MASKKNNKAISELRRWAARLQRISEDVIGCGPRPGVRKNHGIEDPAGRLIFMENPKKKHGTSWKMSNKWFIG
jgi:hypothetical protein